MGSTTFEFNMQEIKQIIDLIREKFGISSESKDDKQNIVSRLILSNKQHTLNLIFYGTGKCLLQGRDGDFFENVKSCLGNIKGMQCILGKESKILDIDENEVYKEKECIIGFDEAGKGECIGPFVFSSVLLPKDKLHLFKNLKSDIKSLSLKELNYYCELLRKNNIRFEYEIISSLEITNRSISMNRFMDDKYIGLIRKYAGVINPNFILAIDDYTIRDELQKYLENLKGTGINSICQSKLDECITATKLASVIARRIRLTEMEDLERRNRLVLNGREVSFGKGAPNEQTKEWLIAHRKIYPTFEFPDFVRKNWKNVEEIESEYPKKYVELKIVCPECKTEISKILIYDNRATCKIDYYCHQCKKLIDKNHLKNYKFHYILCDTNAYVSGIISKDLNSEVPIFENSCIIQPFKILNEIDTIRLPQKRGAQKELERLKEFADKKKIAITTKDYEITDPFDADKKLYGMIAKQSNWVLISGDYNVADSSHSNGAFVFKVINYDPQLTKNVN